MTTERLESGNSRLHLDAAAAKGIIERKGFLKVRHIDVNVLWLQETCARKAIPLNQVSGTENCAHLMTKHLGRQLIEENISRMNMLFESGRAVKAAQLHSVESRGHWKALREAANDQRGGE